MVSRPTENPRRLALLSGARGQFFNVDATGAAGGDGLFVLAPTQKLMVPHTNVCTI